MSKPLPVLWFPSELWYQGRECEKMNWDALKFLKLFEQKLLKSGSISPSSWKEVQGVVQNEKLLWAEGRRKNEVIPVKKKWAGCCKVTFL